MFLAASSYWHPLRHCPRLRIEQAAALARVIHFNRGLAEVKAQLPSLYQKAGDLRKAEDSIQASIEAHREMGEVYALPHHLAIQANIQAAAGEMVAAERTFATGEHIVGNMLANTPTPGVKTGGGFRHE